MEHRIKSINIKSEDITNDGVQLVEESEKILDGIVYNYNILIKDGISIIDEVEKLNLSKPKVIYELFFCMELLLKLFLIKYSNKTLKQIGGYGHNIDNMVNELKSIYTEIDLEAVYESLKYFVDMEGHKISFNEYYDIKYNHRVGSKKLLLNYSFEEKEKLKVKDVVAWMKKNLKN